MSESPSRSTAHRSYDPARFARLFAIEDKHFWFRARNKVIADLVSTIVADLAPGYRVLEVGCGTGNVLRVLEQVCAQGVVVGVDLFGEGLQYARQRVSCPIVQGNIHTLPFDVQFDLIGIFDVLEHLADDTRVLRDLHAMLTPTGSLFLTVPAHMSLWRPHDVVAHHCRRYEVAGLELSLSRTGFRVEYLTQYMISMYALVWLGQRLATLSARRPNGDAQCTEDLASSDLRVVPVVNELLALLLTQESRFVARRRRLPIGTSLLAVARKRSAESSDPGRFQSSAETISI